MSEASSSDSTKSMEPDRKATRQLLATTNNSDESSLSLSDMPVDVVALIIEKLNYKHQLKLRRVSKSLRSLVDNQKPACKSIRFDCSDEYVCMNFNEQRVMYKYGYEPLHYTGIVVIREDFTKVAFNDLASAFKNPKLQLEEIRVIIDKINIENCSNEFRNLLTALDHQMSVGAIEFKVTSPSCLLSILPYLKPGVLKCIVLNLNFRGVDWTSDSTEMDQVALLDQWKHCEELQLYWSLDRLPVKYATHFKRFLIFESDTDSDKFLRIKDYLSKLDNFEHCTLFIMQFALKPDSAYQMLGAPVSTNTTEEVFHHPITDSNYYFEFKRTQNSARVRVDKKKLEIY